jgi:hypothetical protein
MLRSDLDAQLAPDEIERLDAVRAFVDLADTVAADVSRGSSGPRNRRGARRWAAFRTSGGRKNLRLRIHQPFLRLAVAK